MAAKDNLTAVLYGIEDMRLEQRPIPQISDDEVLLEMDCVGICGSDVHYLQHGRIGDFILTKPMIIGHESSGVVAKLGKNVQHLKVGDRVAIEPGVPCRYCDFCKQGQYNLCPDIVFCATPPYDGNLTRYYKHAADFCFKLPEHVTMEEAALLEPLSVGVHACRRAGVQIGSNVLVLGAGPIGLVTLLTAKAMGASSVLITDLVQQRLDVAKSLGADYTLLMKREDNAEDVAKQVHSIMGTQPDKTIDCCGAETTTRLGIFSTRSGGCVVVVGMGSAETKIPLINALAREVDIRGVFRYCNDYSAALALVAAGKVNVRPLVTHHFDITETAKAFETSRRGLGGAIKEQRPIPKISDNEVLLEMHCIGICGTDIHFYRHGRMGDRYILRSPMIVGHESSGIVVEAGKSVKNLKVGDRVAIEPGLPCRICELCRQGRYTLCPLKVLGSLPPQDGFMTRFQKHPADFCYKLPDHVTMEEGALMEPVAVAVHACRRAAIDIGCDVLILGAGPIGLVTLLTAKAMGASRILITDLNESRLETARNLGATHTLLTSLREKPEDLAKRVQATLACQPNKTIDCCGVEATVRAAIFATRSGGTCVIVGLASDEVQLPLINALVREVDVLGAFCYCNDYPAALDLVASGKICSDALITHHFDIENILEAYRTVATGNAIKVIVHMQPRHKNNNNSNSSEHS